jgi:hypothetical protein
VRASYGTPEFIGSNERIISSDMRKFPEKDNSANLFVLGSCCQGE